MSDNKSDNGQTPAESDIEEMIDLGDLLSRISESLITVDTVETPAPDSPSSFSPFPFTTTPVDLLRYLIITLGDESYGLSTDLVEEVIISPLITTVPGLPDWVVGVTNIHGEIASVVHLGRFLGGPDASWDSGNPMVLTKAGGQRIVLLVDDVQSIYTFPVEEIFSPPYKVSRELIPYLQGIIRQGEDVIHLLDCESLLVGEAMQQFG